MEAPSEAQLPRKTGGWITFPFITGLSSSLSLPVDLNLVPTRFDQAFQFFNNVKKSKAMCYDAIHVTLFVAHRLNICYSNIACEFDVESIDAVQIANLVNGAGSLTPVLAAIIADSFLGCFSTIWISSIISLLGTLLLALTATVDSLRPKPCEVGSTSCTPKPKVQYVVLYAAIFLATLGSGGTRSTLSTIGADQLADKPKDQGIFFNWFFFFWYSASVIASTAIVYVEDNVSWKAGFFICVAANVLGSAIFLMGSRFYAHFKPKGSPFTSLARVIVASIRKRQVALPSTAEDFFQGCNVVPKEALAVVPSMTFR
ncbi:protein NRT1/ PTR FAMILY 2.3-like [Solanum stenotomum]|uniref:protein NRT1/ PTR FAMILY 2.3-like n=1 Tax=Solanum stenotomum TaxID=172797 RepID=UPI0020D13E11|nr:protein NRT1/ PTR FAMILY 2.3-like [Solanum stenotomum]